MTTAASRLPAAERRRAVIEAALRVFSQGSYSAATTAQIAREAAVSEPILYRHFPSKRELYFACVEHAWSELRVSWERAIAATADPAEWLPAMAGVALERHRVKAFLANLWIQAVTEAGGDEEIRRYLRGHVREVHDFVAGVIRRCQEEGVVPSERDAGAEAWITLAVGLLATFGQRLGGVLTDEDFGAIRAARKGWLLGGG